MQKSFKKSELDFKKLTEEPKKVVRNHFVASQGYVSCIMDNSLTIIHGFTIVKQQDLKVLIC